MKPVGLNSFRMLFGGFIKYSTSYFRTGTHCQTACKTNLVLSIRLIKTYAQLSRILKREPSNEEIANVLHANLDEINDTLRSAGKHISMDAPLLQGEDAICLI